jgi:AraC family transcriptional activator of pyochelin receptor
MYAIAGNDLAHLLKTSFSKDLQCTHTSGSLPAVFTSHSQQYKSDDFDILHFRGSFEKDVQVYNLNDATHISLHFQLTGHSDAYISGIGGMQPMRAGQVNLFNCVEPVSTFVFPKQKAYEYISVGLKPSFFLGIAEQLSIACDDVTDRILRNEAFALFNHCVMADHWQRISLQQLQSVPLADDLKAAYTSVKIQELLLLTFNKAVSVLTPVHYQLKAEDVRRLTEVKTYLSVNYLQPLTLEVLWRNFRLNEFKLKKGFKELFGVTVFGYIHQLRMEHANNLLADTSLSVGEVASMVGYASDSAFIRAYKLQYGTSPNKARL